MRSTTQSRVRAGVLALGAVSGAVHSAEQETDTLKLEEVTVIAQKRVQNLQDVPIAISAVTADAMEKSGITSSSDLPTIVPALTVGRQAGSGVTFIRGIGTNNAAVGSEASVALYVDGIYAPFAAVNVTNFNNIDHIEVLKGPQGTLFGRNTTGGLVHVVTKNPESTPALQVKAGYGNYDTTHASLYGTTGITDNIAADLAVYYKDQGNSYLENSYLDEDYRPEEDLSFRSKWSFNFGENTALTLSFAGSDSKGASGVTRQPAKGSLGLGGQPYSGDFYDLPSDWPASWHNKSKAVTARFEHEFDAAKFVSLTGWRDDEQKYVYSADSAIIFFQNLLGDMFSKAVSQEFQLLSKEGDGPFSWVVGAYLYDNKTGYNDLDIIVPSAASPIVIDDEQHTKSYSVFGEGRWQATDKTGFTLGARYSRDEVELSGNTYATANRVSVAGAYSDDTDFEEPTWRAGVDHRFNPDLMAYFTYSHGYKMGFYNAIPASGVVAPPVGPEKLDAFEVGVKSDLLDGQLRLNAAAFYYDFKDIQVVTLIPPVQRNANAAKSSLYGGELEAQVRATSRLSLNFGVSLLDATFDSFREGILFVPNPAGGAAPTPADLSGNEIPRSPTWTLNASSSYTIPTSVGEFAWNLAYNHNDGFYWEADNQHRQDAYDLINTEITWTSANGVYGVSVWGKNLLDEEYAIYGVTSTAGNLYSPAEPLTYGVTFSVSF